MTRTASLVTLALASMSLLSNAAPAAAQAADPALERARRILAASPVVDGHNDLPWEIRTHGDHPRDVAAYDLTRRTSGHTDLERLRAGGVGAQFWSIYIPGEIADSGYARVQLEQFDIARRMVFEFGMSEVAPSRTMRADNYALSEETKQLRDTEQTRLTDSAYLEAQRLLAKHRVALDRLAQALLEKETLVREEMAALLVDVPPESRASETIGTVRAISAE